MQEIDIDNLTEDELIDLNRRIVARLKFLESMHSHKEMMKFAPGDQVSFDPPGDVTPSSAPWSSTTRKPSPSSPNPARNGTFPRTCSARSNR